MSIENPESGIAFYSVRHTAETVETFYSSVVEWFQSLGYPPDKAAIRAPGHSGKYVSFGRADVKLAKNGFAGVTSMEISALMPDAQFLANDYFLTAQYSRKFSFMYVGSLGSIASLSRSVMLPLAQRIIDCACPEYGIGYMRDRSLGPSLYAVGINKGEELSYEEALRISRWGNASKAHVWREGLLRDIYPWNFITHAHLRKQVNGISLQEWIVQDSQRGEIIPLSKDISLWDIKEINILTVRKILQDNNIIFELDKHIHLLD